MGLSTDDGDFNKIQNRKEDYEREIKSITDRVQKEMDDRIKYTIDDPRFNAKL